MAVQDKKEEKAVKAVWMYFIFYHLYKNIFKDDKYILLYYVSKIVVGYGYMM